MPDLVVQVDINNRKGVFNGIRVLSVYNRITLVMYNLGADVDLATLQCGLFLPDGRALATIPAFTYDDTGKTYTGVLDTGTDVAISAFQPKTPDYVGRLTLVVSDKDTTYINSVVDVKNNPLGIPVSPSPISEVYVREAPKDGILYGRRNGAWELVSTISSTTMDLIEELALIDFPANNDDVTDTMKSEQIRKIRAVLLSIIGA